MHYKHMNIIFLADLFLSISTVITNPFSLSLSGDKNDNIPSLFQTSSQRYQISQLKNHLDTQSNLAFPDILSRNVTLSESNRLQPQHKEILHDISIYDQDGHKIHYTIKHEEEQNASFNDFYPIICQQGKTRKTLTLENDGIDHHVEDYFEDNEILATM